MSVLEIVVGGGIVVGVLSALTQAVAPEPQFMIVHELSYNAGQITARRTVSGPSTVADWRVTIVGKDRDAPTCYTIPGENKHEGWSPYLAGYSEAAMSVDDWVGQVGCYDQLTPGDYQMLVNWTPRDGRRPAFISITFTI